MSNNNYQYDDNKNGNIQTIELNNSALQRKSESRPDVLATRSSRVISNTQNIFCGRRLHRPFLGTIKLWRLRPMTMHSYISGVLEIFGVWRDIAQSALQTPLRQLPFGNGSLQIGSTPLGGCIGLF